MVTLQSYIDEIIKDLNSKDKEEVRLDMTIFILYMIFLLGNLLFSSDRILIHSHARISIKGGNYIPIYNTIKDYNNNILNDHNVTAKCIIDTSIKNIIAFIPLGFLVPIAFNKCKKISEAIKLGFIVSGIIEITQVLFRLGIFDIDDVILNTLGTIIGFLCFKLFIKIENRYKLMDKLIFH